MQSSRDQLANAERALRQRLGQHPTDVDALQKIADLYLRSKLYERAERALCRALQIAPGLSQARWMLASCYFHRGKWRETVAELDFLLKQNADNPDYLALRAYALLYAGECDASVRAYECLLSKHPTAETLKDYGHALKTVGRQQEAVAAYRRAIAQKSDFGVAYWCLAELKTFRFTAVEVAAMRGALDRHELSPRDRAHFHFALAKALEDEKQYPEAFEHFRLANAAVRAIVTYDADRRSQFVQRCKRVFTPAFFQARQGWGSESSGPIFVVGLPRSGTTLIEQILSSHSAIEPTQELQALQSVQRRLSRAPAPGGRPYPEIMNSLTAAEMRAAGEEYMAAAQPYRRLRRPFFIDKMPNNFNYLGLIACALPNAKVIDVRRHPLGSGVAIFRHLLDDAYSFSFDLRDIGHYYRSYVEVMSDFDAVLPGRVHRVIYERLVKNPEGEIRNLLDYCGLPFEESCLRFHETNRAILPPSSEQVRMPIFSDAAELWRRYEPWLGPLKAALGDVLERYP